MSTLTLLMLESVARCPKESLHPYLEDLDRYGRALAAAALDLGSLRAESE